jgi:hypothetical protein
MNTELCGRKLITLNNAQSQSQRRSQGYITTDRQSASLLGFRHTSVTLDQCFSFFLRLLLDSSQFVDIVSPFRREVESIVFSCCWASLFLYFNSRSGAGRSLFTSDKVILLDDSLYAVAREAVKAHAALSASAPS